MQEVTIPTKMKRVVSREEPLFWVDPHDKVTQKYLNIFGITVNAVQTCNASESLDRAFEGHNYLQKKGSDKAANDWRIAEQFSEKCDEPRLYFNKMEQ